MPEALMTNGLQFDHLCEKKMALDHLLVKTCFSLSLLFLCQRNVKGARLLCSSREGSALGFVLVAVFPAGLGNETHLLESRKVVKEGAQCHVGGWRGHLRS